MGSTPSFIRGARPASRVRVPAAHPLLSVRLHQRAPGFVFQRHAVGSRWVGVGSSPDPRLRQRASVLVPTSRGAARVAESVDAPGSVLEGSNPSGGSSPPAGNAEGAFKQLPNKRLKLAGVYRLSGGRCVVPLAGHGLRPTALRRRAGRPQLKRDPLGSCSPPFHSSTVLNDIEVRCAGG